MYTYRIIDVFWDASAVVTLDAPMTDAAKRAYEALGLTVLRALPTPDNNNNNTKEN